MLKKTQHETKLTTTHLLALELYRQNTLSYTDIAKKCGWNRTTLSDLINGVDATPGTAAEMFFIEAEKISKERDKNIKKLYKDSKEKALHILNEQLVKLNEQKPDAARTAQATRILNSLSKVAPKVEIGSFHYTQGLSAEDLVNEFRRLKGLVSQGRGVPTATERRAGALSRFNAEGSPAEEEPETPLLRSDLED